MMLSLLMEWNVDSRQEEGGLVQILGQARETINTAPDCGLDCPDRTLRLCTTVC